MSTRMISELQPNQVFGIQSSKTCKTRVPFSLAFIQWWLHDEWDERLHQKKENYIMLVSL